MGICGISLLVNDQQQAKDYFVDKLGFCVTEDIIDPDDGHRWLVVSSTDEDPVGIILNKASEAQQAFVGKQGGNDVFLILQTSNFDDTYRTMIEKGVIFDEAPRTEPYGKVAIFKDLCGNQWDLIERY